MPKKSANPLAGENLNTPAPFRFNSSKVYLTYSRCDLKPNEILDWFKINYSIEKYLIGQEHHTDGGLHIHALFFFSNKVDKRSERCFDINEFHPNIVSRKFDKDDLCSIIKYICKEGNYITNFTEEELEDYNTTKDSYKNLFECKTKTEFMEKAKKIMPRDYILNHEKLEYFCAKHFKPVVPEYIPRYTDFCVPSIMSDWVKNELPNKNRARCLILHGGTRNGKTEWARHFGKHMYFRNYFSLKDWDDDANYIVFDDMEEMKNHKALLCCMGECVITDKYMGKNRIINNKPAIYLCNDREPWMENSYWEQNAIFVEITKKLWKTQGFFLCI